MIKNDLKKMIVFTNQKNKKVVENFVHDEAERENRSASSLIESHILNDIMPKNNNVRNWIFLLYSENWKIEDVLIAFFDFCSVGVNFRAKENNCLKLIEYIYEEERHTRNPFPKNAPEMHHFLSQFDSLVENLEKNSSAEQVKWAKELLTNLENNRIEFINFVDLYDLIIHNWEALKEWSFTFRLLCDLVKMQEFWRNDSRQRLEIVELLTDISSEWKD